MILRLVFALVMAALFALPACGSLPTGKVPVDSQIKPWEKPDEDELLEGDDEDDDGDVEDADDAADTAPAPTATAPAPAKAD